MKILFAVVCVVASVSINGAGQAVSIERELNAAQDELQQAVQRQDTAAFAKLTADDWMGFPADGRVQTKASRIEEIRKGIAAGPPQGGQAPPLLNYRNEEYGLRVYGDVAVTTWRAAPSQANPGGLRFTRIWAKRNGGWQQVQIQQTPIVAR